MTSIERAIQIKAVVDVRLLFPDVILASIPNGGYVIDARTGHALKAEGLTPGFPDLIAIWPGGWGLIEMKAPKGVLSHAQRELFPKLIERGVNLAVCRSTSEVIDALTKWGAKSRVRAA